MSRSRSMWAVLAIGTTLSLAVLFVPQVVYATYTDGADELVRVNRFTGRKEYATDSGWKTMDQLRIQARDNILADVRRDSLRGQYETALWKADVLTMRTRSGQVIDSFYGTPQDTGAVQAALDKTGVPLRVEPSM